MRRITGFFCYKLLKVLFFFTYFKFTFWFYTGNFYVRISFFEGVKNNQDQLSVPKSYEKKDLFCC